MGSSTYYGASHLDFIKQPLEKGKKLPIYEVWNTKFQHLIGEIHWRGGWRQFVFEAHPEIDMSRSCMKEVSQFIDKLMKDWKESLKNNRRIKKMAIISGG